MMISRVCKTQMNIIFFMIANSPIGGVSVGFGLIKGVEVGPDVQVGEA